MQSLPEAPALKGPGDTRAHTRMRVHAWPFVAEWRKEQGWRCMGGKLFPWLCTDSICLLLSASSRHVKPRAVPVPAGSFWRAIRGFRLVPNQQPQKGDG